MIHIILPKIKDLNDEEKQLLKLEKYKYDIKNKNINSVEELVDKKDIFNFLKDNGWEYLLYIHSRFCVIYNNYGQCKYRKNGTEDEQYFGIVVQNALALYLKNKGINYRGEEDDKGIDYIINNCNVDIKNTGRNVNLNKGYVFNLFAAQVHSDYLKSDFYILSSFNKKEMSISISAVVPRKIIPEICRYYKGKEYSFNNNPRKKIGGDSRYEVVVGLIEKDFGVNTIKDIYKRCNKEILTKTTEELLEESFYNKCNITGYVKNIDNVEINFYNFKDKFNEEVKIKSPKTEIPIEIQEKVKNDYLKDCNIKIENLLKNDIFKKAV